MDWWNLMKQSVTVDAQLLWGGRYGCNNGRYGCTIVMSYMEINKAVSQWLLIFNLCVSVTWPLTCAFRIPCTHTPEIIELHRGMCDNVIILIACAGTNKWHGMAVGKSECWLSTLKRGCVIGNHEKDNGCKIWEITGITGVASMAVFDCQWKCEKCACLAWHLWRRVHTKIVIIE